MVRRVLPLLARCASAAALVVAFTFAGVARADVASDKPAAILVFPKIIVDTSMATLRGPVDTLVRISNTASQPVSVHCFLVNANGHCRNSKDKVCDPTVFGPGSPCGSTGVCDQGWNETDFDINMTAGQPVAWLASSGEAQCDSSDTSGLPCLPLGGNQGSRIPGVPEDPFIGELKCVEVDTNSVPIDHNDLKGEAEIVQFHFGQLDVEGYNAIGIPALPGRNNGDATLVLGGDGAEYTSCPNVLILDHFLDGATDPVSGDPITTELTLVPCSEDFQNQAPITATVQFNVYNEFEQRYSTSRIITCFFDMKISNIDTWSSDSSIFSAGVFGTLTAQTRLRGVDANSECTAISKPFPCCTGSATGTCNGKGAGASTLLGLAEEFRGGGNGQCTGPAMPVPCCSGVGTGSCVVGSAAFNLHFQGTRPTSDFIRLLSN